MTSLKYLLPASCTLSWLLWTVWPSWKVIFSINCAPLVFIYLARQLRDPYAIDIQTPLNARTQLGDGNLDEAQKTTEWINMGFWKNTNEFPVACEALALKLIASANCVPGGVVLDAGHGCGDSLLLHLNHPSVPRPSRLVGITSQSSHYQRALVRTKAGNSDKVHVELVHGNAIYEAAGNSSHPLNTTSHGNIYNSILALDCAYHFTPRHQFLAQAFTCLAPGGRIALADLCFIPGSLTLWRRISITLSGFMPWDNIITTEEYVADLAKIGYTDIHLEDITKDVFPKFTQYLRKFGLAYRILARQIDKYHAYGMRFVIIAGTKPPYAVSSVI